MPLLIRTVLSSLPLMALPAVAADSTTTGITSVGPAIFIFAIAAALLLTLLFRSTASHLINHVMAQFGNCGYGAHWRHTVRTFCTASSCPALTAAWQESTI